MECMIRVSNTAFRVRGKFLKTAYRDGEQYVFLDDPRQVIADLKKHPARVDLFTFIGRLPDGGPTYPFHSEPDNAAVVTVTSFEHWWKVQIDGKTRNAARQAAKRSVEIRRTVCDDAFLSGIVGIYNESPIRQGRPFPHYKKALEAVRRETLTFSEQSTFIGAYLGDELIGFIKLVADETGIQAGLMSILSMVKHRDKAPTNALLAEAVRVCAEKGIRYLWYSKFDYGKKQRDTLREFKVNNGFQRLDLPRYYVPLTSLGWCALRMGLQKGLADRLPQSLADTLRGTRSWWNRKSVLAFQHEARNSSAGTVGE